MCTLGAISSKFLFKNRDMGPDSGIQEDLVQERGRYKYVGVAGHASPLERGLNSGINEAGVSVAVTFVDHVPLPESISVKTPRGVLVEEILRTAGDLTAALRIISDYFLTPLVGGNIVILTPQGGAVIEQIYPRFAVEIIETPITIRTNHFLNLALPRETSIDQQNTHARFQRFSQLLAPAVDSNFGLTQIHQALSDHAGKHPICRHGSQGRTVSTAIYDLRKKVLHYTYGNPCEGKFQSLAV
ncbi:MAG TPA: carcinine hydrolase/isopenicillin-N N-acyltransferase family protein [Negativicutes bacterium]|nr:carcinine hydrolase/isopenicillin-N N-acyltransferase family protein [Negativicutes bacterium]